MLRPLFKVLTPKKEIERNTSNVGKKINIYIRMELWEEKCELRMVQEGPKEEAMLKF